MSEQDDVRPLTFALAALIATQRLHHDRPADVAAVAKHLGWDRGRTTRAWSLLRSADGWRYVAADWRLTRLEVVAVIVADLRRDGTADWGKR